MTLQDFIATRPQSYGSGNANLLYSSSVVNPGVDDTPVAPFHIQGLSIPFISKGGVNVSAALKEVDEFKFDFEGGQKTAKVTGRQKKTEYFYFTIEEIITNTLPTGIDAGGNTVYNDSQFVFLPYITTGFKNNDYNPLVNNSEISKLNDVRRVADKVTSQYIPTNLPAIIDGSAQYAQIQNCSYTKAGIINSRYNGSKATAAGPVAREYNKQKFSSRIQSSFIIGNEPSLSFKEFKGSLHAHDADITTVKNINQSDREITTVYFKSEISGSHPNKTFPDFPYSGSILYIDGTGNRLVRLAERRIYSIDTGNVFTSNLDAGVISVD